MKEENEVIDRTGKLDLASDLWRLTCLEQRAKLTWETLGLFERPEIRRVIRMVDHIEELLKLTLTLHGGLRQYPIFQDNNLGN